MWKEILIVSGSLVCGGLFVWLMFSVETPFHAGFLFGLGLCFFTVRMLHGFWIGDERYRKRGV